MVIGGDNPAVLVASLLPAARVFPVIFEGKWRLLVERTRSCRVFFSLLRVLLGGSNRSCSGPARGRSSRMEVAIIILTVIEM